jgi:hypothetical protein
VGARTESAREMARESGRGLDGGDMGPSYGACRMFSTLCDRMWEYVGLLARACPGFSGAGELCGTCCSGRSAFRALAIPPDVSVSDEPK